MPVFYCGCRDSDMPLQFAEYYVEGCGTTSFKAMAWFKGSPTSSSCYTRIFWAVSEVIKFSCCCGWNKIMMQNHGMREEPSRSVAQKSSSSGGGLSKARKVLKVKVVDLYGFELEVTRDEASILNQVKEGSGSQQGRRMVFAAWGFFLIIRKQFGFATLPVKFWFHWLWPVEEADQEGNPACASASGLACCFGRH